MGAMIDPRPSRPATYLPATRQYNVVYMARMVRPPRFFTPLLDNVPLPQTEVKGGISGVGSQSYGGIFDLDYV